MNGLLSLAILCICGHLTVATWTQAHRNQILKIHNDYRRGVKGACDMTDLVYDRSIENKARSWANKCVFEHEKKGFGENIAWSTKVGTESELLVTLAKMWYDEVKLYTYGMDGCGSACHYTQLVWANTKKVGCYAADCAKLKEGGDNAYFLVCFYSPPGNYYGEQPYKKDCSKKGNKNKGGSNKGPSSGNKNNNNPASNNNKDDDWADWDKNFKDMGNTDNWDSAPDGWNVVKKTGSDGKGGTWTVWTSKKSNK